MRHIDTTEMVVDKLVREARRHQSRTGDRLAVSMEIVAKQAGYESAGHLRRCRKNTDARLAALKAAINETFVPLHTQHQDKPGYKAVRQAGIFGVLLAYGFKEAESSMDSLVAGGLLLEPFGFTLCGGDIVREHFVQRFAEKGDAFDANWTAEEVSDRAVELSMDYQFFRMRNPPDPLSVQAVYRATYELSFWHPLHVWISGIHCTMEDVPDIIIDGAALKQLRRPADY